MSHAGPKFQHPEMIARCVVICYDSTRNLICQLIAYMNDGEDGMECLRTSSPLPWFFSYLPMQPMIVPNLC